MQVQPLSPSRKIAFDGDMMVALVPRKFGAAVEYAQICHSDGEWGHWVRRILHSGQKVPKKLREASFSFDPLLLSLMDCANEFRTKRTEVCFSLQ